MRDTNAKNFVATKIQCSLNTNQFCSNSTQYSMVISSNPTPTACHSRDLTDLTFCHFLTLTCNNRPVNSHHIGLWEIENVLTLYRLISRLQIHSIMKRIITCSPGNTITIQLIQVWTEIHPFCSIFNTTTPLFFCVCRL